MVTDRSDGADLLRALSLPRLVGTPNHNQVRERLKRELAKRGFTVELHAFAGAPSRMLLGAPARVHGVNLIARRGRRPSIWLAAHYDSKGQPISMATRMLGAAAFVVGALTAFWTPIPSLVLLAIGALILAANRVTDRSAGALDNATGLVVILGVLDQLPRAAEMGVLFLDAEEYGLVGARALVQDRGEILRDAAVINFDSLDDRGWVLAFQHRAGPIGRAVVAELGALRGPWFPIIVDGIALARAPLRECVSIMKGNWGTARVVHTPKDQVERLALEGVRQVVAGVARALGSP